MLDVLKWRPSRLQLILLWVAVMLTLPAIKCATLPSGLIFIPVLDPGPDAVFCNIETVSGRHCASAAERANGIRLSAAAVAITQGQRNQIGLDDSPAALARCGGTPEAVTFQGPFPDGLPVCLDCSPDKQGDIISTDYMCAKKCEELIDAGAMPAPPDKVAYCAANAHAATNFPSGSCFTGVCTTEGTLRADFVDPRRTPEAVVWIDLIGTVAGGAAQNDLTRTAATTGTTTADFNAGAVSTQWFTKGDGWVEFQASERDRSHAAGLSEVPGGCANPAACPDTDPHLTGIKYSIGLQLDGNSYVLEDGVLIPNGATINFGAYAVGERYRVKVRDNQDGTATISYARVVGSCTPGTPCPDTVFHTSAVPAHYPLRVDTSFREQGGTLADFRVVRVR